MKLLHLSLLTALLTISLQAGMEDSGYEPDSEVEPQVGLYSSASNAYYIASTKIREQLQKAWGKEFPANAIFLRLRFQNYRDLFLFPFLHPHEVEEGSTVRSKGVKVVEAAPRIPEFASFDDIKEWKDGQEATILIQGQAYTFLCKQAEDGQSTKSFEMLVNLQIKTFQLSPNYFYEDEQELLRQGVIKEIEINGAKQMAHGINGYSFPSS